MKKLLSVLFVVVAGLSGLSAQDHAVYHVGNTDFVPPGTTIDLSAIDDGVGVAKIWYKINDSEAKEYSKPLVFSAEGRYSIYHWTEDLLGNLSAPQVVSFAVDATSPTWKVATSGPSYLKDGVLYIKSTTGLLILPSDAGSGVASVYFSIDKQNYIPFKDEVFVNEAGARSAWAYATDHVGNKSEPAEIKLFVDDKAPDVAIVPISPLVVAKGERYTKPGNSFAVRADDDRSGVKTVEVSVNRQDFFTYTDPLVLTEPGVYSIRARATDNLGNVSTVQELTFTVDAGSSFSVPGKLTVPADAPVAAAPAATAPAASAPVATPAPAATDAAPVATPAPAADAAPAVVPAVPAP